ncbi:hypothetical protein PTSG_07023 [Salpingoeca rosetta]|uniref:Potassium channel domain-containing protein n=1 Tax=Salpingoeca rosetta (strain ATCC 50818 / BSB-021) TaxID=946362 RepID=F2UDU0_SALR5|nr:uncharacterized protein PTSG_07023 [Salpingoeca rosetta]EGD74790.1 hypothetical protein PTSG_07023 [Salpingoeca rosetta]|eukprot:XP_004992435.1 hypothetical protein PTSG_07023 [Salpingoeca rosetta]
MQQPTLSLPPSSCSGDDDTVWLGRGRSLDEEGAYDVEESDDDEVDDGGDGLLSEDDVDEPLLLSSSTSTASRARSTVGASWYSRNESSDSSASSRAAAASETRRELKSLGLYADATLVWVGVFLVLVYLVLGCVFYVATDNSLVIDGAVTRAFVDAFYFTTVTLSTVGYGDVHPEQQKSKLFTSVFILFGVIVVGYCVGVVVVELHEVQHHQTKEQLARAELELFEPASVIRDCADTEQPPIRRICTELRPVIKAALIMLLTIGIGMVIISLDNPQSSFADALYFASVSVTTVGYGDVRVHTTAGKVIVALYSIFATAAFAQALATIASFPIAYRQRRLQSQVLHQHGSHLARQDLNDVMFANRNASRPFITREEFTLRLLLRMNKITHEDVRACHRQFAVLDADHNLQLDPHDVRDKD